MKTVKQFQVFPKRLGIYPYIFLLFLYVPIVDILSSSGLKMWLGFLLIILFLISYRNLYWYRYFDLWLGMQMGIIFLLTLLFDPYNIFLGLYTSNFIGWYDDKKKFNIVYSIFLVTTFIEGVIFYIQIGYLSNSLLLVLMLVMPVAIRSMNRNMELEEKLNKANEKIDALVQREERLRISRDLHDTLGHTLSMLTLQGQLVQRLVKTDPERAEEVAKEIEYTSRAALKQVRELVSDMRQLKIEEIIPEMEKTLATAEILLHHNGKKIDFDEIPLLDQNILSMCLKECMTNIVKHSHAKNCYITFKSLTKSFIITIEDDGIGIKSEKTDGNGIKGMKERLAIINGELEIKSTKHGTTVIITIPVVQKQKKEVIA